AGEDVDGAGVEDAADVLLDDSDGEVVDRVAVEVSRHQGPAEVIVRLEIAEQAALVPELIAVGGQAVLRPIEDQDRAGVGPVEPPIEVPNILVGDADGQVAVAVAVEVSRDQGATEVVILLGVAVDPRAVLMPDLSVGGAPQPGPGAVADLDLAGIADPGRGAAPDGRDVFLGHAHREVGEAVTVEVAPDARQQQAAFHGLDAREKLRARPPGAWSPPGTKSSPTRRRIELVESHGVTSITGRGKGREPAPVARPEDRGRGARSASGFSLDHFHVDDL